ncbi:MAG: M16 family metallopeptidase [Candidatus Coprovivens sp.]
MEYKVHDCGTYKIHTIKTDKFKTCSMEIMYRNVTDKNKLTDLNMIVDVLMNSSKKYQTRREVNIALENLYSASCRGFLSNIGNSHCISFITDFLNPKYCEEGFLEEVLGFSIDMIKNPNISDGKFNNNSFNIVKNRLKSEIESLKENPTRYAFRRALINMDKNSISSCSRLGDLKHLEKITTSNLMNIYNEIMNEYTCDIYVIGNLDMEKVVNIIRGLFNHKKTNDKVDLYVNNKCCNDIKDVRETGKYEQDSLVLIYNLDNLTKRERDFVIHLYNIILGSGGLTSKLYKYIREQNSLCYNVSSMYMKYDNLLMIYAGIDEKDKDLCIKLINKAMKEMITGDFTPEELANAKLSVESSIRMSEDNMGGIINNYLFNELDNLPLYDERIKTFKTITKKEIMELASKLKLNTIYVLAGEDK